jgi:hypothetical protein
MFAWIRRISAEVQLPAQFSLAWSMPDRRTHDCHDRGRRGQRRHRTPTRQSANVSCQLSRKDGNREVRLFPARLLSCQRRYASSFNGTYDMVMVRPPGSSLVVTRSLAAEHASGEPVQIWTRERIAQLAVQLGLGEWITPPS